MIAAALSIRDLQNLTEEQRRQINASTCSSPYATPFSPASSPLRLGSRRCAHAAARGVAALIAEGDTRWIERGAYDLVNVDPTAQASEGRFAEGPALRTDQRTTRAPGLLRQPAPEDARGPPSSGLYASHQILVPEVASPGLLAMVHELPEGKGYSSNGAQFRLTSIDETIKLRNLKPSQLLT